VAVEQCTNVLSSSNSSAIRDCDSYQPLEDLSGLAREVFDRYDFPPFVSEADSGTIPFIDFGNRFLEDGSFMDPSVLQGLSHVQIARRLANPLANPGQAILVAANYYTAAICKLTKNRPDSVCKATVVEQALKRLES
jgi:hypothetical protein